MREIKIGQKAKKHRGFVALVDDRDYDELNQYDWRIIFKQGKRTPYAVRTVQDKDGKRLVVKMHNQILAPPRGLSVDHKNHDTLDNRRSNLRLATQAQQAQNTRPRRGGSSSYKGVSWDKKNRKWEVIIQTNGKNKRLGFFENETMGARAYDRASQSAYGEFAYLNFPNEIQKGEA